MLADLNSYNPVIIQFPRFAGGKFISNCLALSKHSVPQDKTMAEYLLENSDDYDYRLNGILKTLPPIEHITNWINDYEYGDFNLFGMAHESWRQGLNGTLNESTVALSKSELKFFITCHGSLELPHLLSIWPNAQIILLKNHNNFQEISAKLKQEDIFDAQWQCANQHYKTYNTLKGTSWPSWEEFEDANYDVRKLDSKYRYVSTEIEKYYVWSKINNNVYSIDVDSCIFDKEKFLQAIENLYKKLDFDDFNPELVSSFWQAYIRLHVDK